MTLHTQILIQAPTDPIALFHWANEHLLHAVEPAFSESEPWGTHRKRSIGNELDQGFDALMWVTWDKDNQIINWSDGWEDDPEMVAYFADYPKGYVILHLDTAYGFQPGEVHARMTSKFAAEFASPRNLPFSWYNEYIDEWHEGTDGLMVLPASSALADNWFNSTVKPALRTIIDFE